MCWDTFDSLAVATRKVPETWVMEKQLWRVLQEWQAPHRSSSKELWERNQLISLLTHLLDTD